MDPLYALALLLLLPGLLGRGVPARFLANPVLRFIGDRSYSLYLVQVLAGLTAQAVFPTDRRGHVQMLITVLIGLAMADVLYRWVEQPMIRLGRRLTGHRKPEAPREVPRVPEPAMAQPNRPAGAGDTDLRPVPATA